MNILNLSYSFTDSRFPLLLVPKFLGEMAMLRDAYFPKGISDEFLRKIGVGGGGGGGGGDKNGMGFRDCNFPVTAIAFKYMAFTIAFFTCRFINMSTNEYMYMYLNCTQCQWQSKYTGLNWRLVIHSRGLYDVLISCSVYIIEAV